jgi:hypothetical protein
MNIMDKYPGKIQKSSAATVADPIFTFKDWQLMHGDRMRVSMMKTAGAPNEKKYLLSHCTIMSSVMTEPDPYDWLIKPEASHLVNNNDDGWENEVLKLSHRSFVGSFNFLEHYQNTKESKGTIVDSILRKINIAEPDIWVYFCDLLVATSLEHEELVEEIKSGDVRYMSMGCVTDVVICSYCGQRVKEGEAGCYHLAKHKGQFIPDDDGVARRVAELCGHKSLPNGGVTFIEASWVETPAFPGAVNRGIIANSWDGPSVNPKSASDSRDKIAKAAAGKEINNRLSNNNMVTNKDIATLDSMFK